MTRLLLASDFDGTLAAIRPDPESVTIDPEALDVLSRATRAEGVEVALVSGRDLEDLRARAPGLRAWYSGSHGQQILAPDGRMVRSAEAWTGKPDPDWMQRARDAGLRLEPKRFGVAVHWRGLEGVDESHPLIAQFEEWARSEGLKVVRGRRVSEASSGGGTKRDVLEILRRETRATRLLYAGDDLTDFPALEFAASHGRGLFMKSPERNEEPPRGVETVHSCNELLREMEEELRRFG